MKELPLDPVVVEMAIPDEYKDMPDAFFTDLSKQEDEEYVTNLKRVISMEYVFLDEDIDNHDSDDVKPREFAYLIEQVDLDGATVETVFGDAREFTHQEIRDAFDIVMLDTYLETYS